MVIEMRNSCILLAVLFLIAFNGCASMSKDTKVQRLETKLNNLEERMQKIEADHTQLQEGISGQAKIKSQGASSIKEGSVESPSKEDIQIALKNAGFYDGNIDGKIGAKTRNAIMEFQKENGLEVDGVVGKNTWGILSKFYISEEKN